MSTELGRLADAGPPAEAVCVGEASSPPHRAPIATQYREDVCCHECVSWQPLGPPGSRMQCADSDNPMFRRYAPPMFGCRRAQRPEATRQIIQRSLRKPYTRAEAR